MKRFAFAALAFAIATPVLADQPRTLEDFSERKAATESGNQPAFFFNDYELDREAALIHVRRAEREDGGNFNLTVEQLLDGPGTIVNQRAAEIVSQIENKS